ncbi:MAG: endolytic transglycosylase MltG [Hyphomicrobiales bacterium]
MALGNGVFTFLLLAAAGFFAAIYFGGKEFEAKGPLAQESIVLVPKGSGTVEIADALASQGVIDSATLFAIAVRVIGKSDELKAGEYAFPAGVSMSGVVDILVDGKAIQHSITIPEGLTTQMIVERLRQDPVLVGDITSSPAEGALLPDTYLFERGTSREQMLQRMQNAHKKLVAEIWARRSPDIILKSPNELVTLASIVEKETGVADERPRVASVFHNRLNKRMKLQSDPTIIYGIVGGKGKLDRPLSRADIKGATAYNTYVIPGLPPGPIANPGRASLEATANPMRTDELFFVADGTGGHAFATTLEDHNANVRRWREIEKSRNTEPGEAGGTGLLEEDAAAAEAAAEPAAEPAKPAKKKKQPAVN